MRRSENGKAAYLENVSVWFNEDQDHIHIAVSDLEYFHTTVNSDAASKRGHPNLFPTLFKALRDAGVSHPPIPKNQNARKIGERLDSGPNGARYGCFLPDLTGLARRSPAPTSRGLT